MTGHEPDSGSAGERHARITELFLEACELPDSKRAGFLDHACGDDLALRSDIEALLAADRQPVARVLLESPPSLPAPAADMRTDHSWTDSAGQLLELDAPRRRAGAGTWVVLAVAALALAWLVPWPGGAPRQPGRDELPTCLARADEARREGRFDEAELMLRTTLRDQIAAHGDSDPGAHDAALRLADLLESRGQAEEAEALRRSVHSIAAEPAS